MGRPRRGIKTESPAKATWPRSSRSGDPVADPGLSIAWAVAEHLHDRIGARTLFATHYHELTALARSRPRVRNLQVAVRKLGVANSRKRAGWDHAFLLSILTSEGT